MSLSEQQMSPVYPFLYVHDLYSNMIDKFSKQMSISWSFYMQADNGQLVVVRSEPKVRTTVLEAVMDDEDGLEGKITRNILCNQ